MRTQKIEVVPYNPQWPEMFAAEAKRLAPAFGSLLVGANHIGGTAIPNCYAKPIIDILGVVADIEGVEACNPAMIALGYEPRGEFGIPGRRYFVRSQGERDLFHLHIFQEGNPEIDRHLGFAAYLVAHPQAAREYGALKQRLVRLFPDDIDSYIEGKGPFIRAIDQKALNWRQKREHGAGP